jgi:hypothetical protein
VGKKLLVTDAHVVDGVFADEIKVRFGTDTSKPLPVKRILYFDRSRDLCVMELPSEMPGLKVRGDYKFNSGDRVTLVGNPTAGGGILIRNAVNHGRFNGVVHAKEQDFYQIDATVNPGWSGGPVLDAEGSVVAIVAMKADDRAVAALRGSMSVLDQEFHSRIGHTAYNVGLTYGIPANDLWKILQDKDLQNEKRQAEANDLCAARILTDRLGFLAELWIIRAQIEVPTRVRAEAALMATGKLPPGVHRRTAALDVIPLIPPATAARLNRLLDDEMIRTIESKYKHRLDERVDAVQNSDTLSEVVKRDLRTLAAKVREVEKFTDHPVNSYLTFSSRIKGFARDFRDHLKRLEENLKEEDEP